MTWTRPVKAMTLTTSSRQLMGRFTVLGLVATTACGADGKSSSFPMDPMEKDAEGPTRYDAPIVLPNMDDGSVEASSGTKRDASTDANIDATKLPGDDCLPTPPSQGAPCSQAMSCTYDACSTTGTTTASCDGTHWSVTTTACAPFPCPANGRTMCMPGEICQTLTAPDFTSTGCVKGACGSGPITCRCAAYGGPIQCIGACLGVNGHEVHCTAD